MSISPRRRPTAAAAGSAPLVVDLDGTLVRSDTLDESFVAAFFRRPLHTLLTVARAILGGRAKLKAALGEVGVVDAETLPYRTELVSWLKDQKREGREIHLATAADRGIAERVAKCFDLFDEVHASDGVANLKGPAKAEALVRRFPNGFAYVGDCRADLAVWARASSGVVVASAALARKAAALTTLEQHISPPRGELQIWLEALRPHQWVKNVLILAPAALGFGQFTPEGGMRALAALGLFCLLSSLTYIVNDIADLQADRRHATKRRRPFATGQLKLRHGLIVAGFGLPLVIGAGWLVSPGVAACLAAYCVTTLSYSLALKRVPILDCFVIGLLFTLRLVTGNVAADLEWSPWLMTFALSFFFSLALAKRHTELVAGGPEAKGAVRGRGYIYEDRGLTLVFGVAAFTASIIIIILYLMEEVFPRGAYGAPEWLWVAPPVLFLWVSRVWLLANRGQMHDDPVVFALRDRVSQGLGIAVGLALLLALA